MIFTVVMRPFAFLSHVLLGTLVISSTIQADQRPNVILIITDDQGYGDISAHGNPRIRTPNLDHLWKESVRLTNFHVDPTCAPTRSALMTGRYSNRTGVWHTIMGRSLMDPDELTLAEIFKENGYSTGMFGKWHLGDNYPLRPEDQGFETVVRHGGGGVGQGPDWWENDYFDDTYWKNGRAEKFSGYCTDVWFEEAEKFINENGDKPFFCYIATNAPHGPLNIADRYSNPYSEAGVPGPMSKFYGMITNIDENIGQLRQFLADKSLAENTLVIFMTDNGTANGWIGGAAVKAGASQWNGFNDGMRGVKGSEYDGGHRVPCFWYWPNGKLSGGKDIKSLTAHIDILPTLVDLCSLAKPTGPKIDGVSLAGVMLNQEIASTLDRTLFVHSQRIANPEKWRKTAAMTARWRLVNQFELYDITRDPAQDINVADKYPEVVSRLTQEYDDWWSSITPTFDKYVRIGIGSPGENPTYLMSHDWVVKEQKDSVWDQSLVKKGVLASGPWAISVEASGMYRVRLYRWPDHLGRPAGCVHAKLKMGAVELEKDMTVSDVHAQFELVLEKGDTMLQSWLTNENGGVFGAYYATIERLNAGD